MVSEVFRIRRSVLAVAFVLAVAADVASGQTLQPAGWDAGVRLREAADVNPDPHVVEITLEARVARVEIAEGVSLDAWTYNGGVPGPLIRVHVGDRLVVHFVNRLPQPTTVHWHGLRIPIQMDGVPDVSQPDVKPGESFTYDFTVPDAGLFWYHPHVMSAAQVGFGLYGALLVEDPAEQRTVGVADELVMVLSDMSIVPAGHSSRPMPEVDRDVFGREGVARAPERAREIDAGPCDRVPRSAGASSTPRRAAISSSIWEAFRSAKSAPTGACRSSRSIATRWCSRPVNGRM